MGAKGKQLPAMDRKNWVGWVPYGLNEQHPNNYLDILSAIRENSDNLGYAHRILRDGCCDGCALGTTGMHDWTIDGIHLCAIRLELLRFNTMPAMDTTPLEDVSLLATKNEKALRHLGRLPYPMVRRKGDKGFRRISWDEATAIAADGLGATDPQRVGWYTTSRGLTNEAYYAHNKVARFVGTNHVDTSARICHSPSTTGLGNTVGVAATTCSYSDWIGTDLLVFVGSNVANNEPVATKYIYYAKKAGTRVVVINPYREPGMERYWVPSALESALFGTKIADDFYQVNAGGDIAFLSGVLKHLVENDWVDHDFIERRTVGFEDVKAKVAALDWASLEQGAGVSRQEMLEFARQFGAAKSAIFVWSMGITQHRFGGENVRAIVNLQLAKGNVGRVNTGLMPIRGHSGVQGGAEMGTQPGSYLMGWPVNEETALRLSADDGWGFMPPTWKGLGVAAMILAAEQGEIDVLWQSGGNFTETLPEPPRVRKALERIKLRIHQDIVLNPTMLIEPADTVLLLPSRTRYEQRGGGCETSTERRVIFSPEIPGPRPGEARDEWEIPVLVARKLDPERAAKAFPWRDTSDIRREIDRLCPTYHGIGALSKKGDNFQYGGPRLLVDSFPTPDGKGHFTAIDLPAEVIPEGKFLLSTRRGKQFNSIIHAEVDPLNGARRADILISPVDASRLGLKDGDAIVVQNEVGRMVGRARLARIQPGCVQGHWPEVNQLIPAGRLDPAGVPDYNALVEIVPGDQAKREQELVAASV